MAEAETETETESLAERKSRWEQHEPTTMEKVTQRLEQEGGVPCPFTWISKREHIQPSPAVAAQYPWLQTAWEALTPDDVKQMTSSVWNNDRLSEVPCYLGWLQCCDHPARKNGRHVHSLSKLELGVFASRDIEQGETVLNYVGAPISYDDANGGSLYSQGFSPGNNTLKIELDAAAVRNLGPMVNDYRDDVTAPRNANTGSSRNANLKPRHTYLSIVSEPTPTNVSVCLVCNHLFRNLDCCDCCSNNQQTDFFVGAGTGGFLSFLSFPSRLRDTFHKGKSCCGVRPPCIQSIAGTR